MVGGLIGYLFAAYGFSAVSQFESLQVLAAWDLLAMLPLFLLVIGVHEGGHVLGGLLRGMRFLLYIVGPFQLTRTGEGIRFSWVFNLGTFGGVAACMPDPSRPLPTQMLPMIAGGPLASALLAALALGLSALLSGRAAAYLVMTGLLSAMIFLVTAVPLRAGGFMSDGLQLLEMRRGGRGVRARHRLTLLMGQSMTGVRPSDWDRTLIAESLAETDDEPLRRVAAIHMGYLHAFDRGDMAEATRLAGELAARFEDYPEGFRQSLAVELALFHALVARDPATSREWTARSRGGVVDPARRALAAAALAMLDGNATVREAELANARRGLAAKQRRGAVGADGGADRATDRTTRHHDVVTAPSLQVIAARSAAPHVCGMRTPLPMPLRRGILMLACLSVGAIPSACARTTPAVASTMAPVAPTTFLSPAEVREGWRSLLSLDQWRGYGTDSMPSGWQADDSLLTKDGVGSDIVTRRTYTDFELAFDWMLDEGGNSGVFYRATEEYPKIYWSAPEYALLDDARHPDGRNPLTSAGAVHSLYAAPRGVVQPAGSWNRTRILVRGAQVEHWLNDRMVAEYAFGSDDFAQRVAGSKFGRWANFGKSPSGVIGIQGDHRGRLAIRHLRIREVPAQR